MESLFLFEQRNTRKTAEEHLWIPIPAPPASVTYLKNLRKDVFDIKSIKFRKVRNKFQEELKEDLSKIRKSRNMFNFEDKTNNVYEMKSD